MGEDFQTAKLYAINQETGEEIELGTLVETVEAENPYTDVEGITEYETEIDIPLNIITKKRFIKLLMGKRIQKREALKIHDLFMKRYKHRSKIGLELFVDFLLW